MQLSRWLGTAAIVITVAGCNDVMVEPSADGGLAASSVVVHTSAATAPAWAIPYGDETWRRSSDALDLGDAVERVKRAIYRAEPDDVPRALGRTFEARFDGAELAFAVDTTAIAHLRSDVSLGSAPARSQQSWSIVGNTAQVLRDPTTGLVEHYEVRDDGVEITWVLRERPAGDLVVDLAVDGLTFAGQTESGVHYADASGQARMRIGGAVLIDARGERWPVATDVVGGMPRWRVGSDVLAAAAYPVALDPFVSAELGVDEPVTTIGAPLYQTAPSIAKGPSGYLAVWLDSRAGINDIYGARVGTDGTILDLNGIVIHEGSYFKPSVDVASNGTNYLVAWTDQRSGSDIYGALVSSAGTVTSAAAGIAISTATNTQSEPDVTSNGTDYFVVWSDLRSGANYDIYGARVTSSGTVSDASGFVVSAGAESQNRAAATYNGANYVVAWHDGRSLSTRSIYAARVSTAGALLDASGIAVATGASEKTTPAIASNGTNTLVTWTEDHNDGDDIRGARLTSAGVVTDTTSLAIGTATGMQDLSAVSSNGTDYLVVWMDSRSGNRDIYASRVTSAGVVSEPNGIPVATGSWLSNEPSVMSDGTNYLVAWEDDRRTPGTYSDIFIARVAAAGTVTDPSGILASAGNLESILSVAASTSGFLVAWQDDRNRTTTGFDIYGARLSVTGAVLDPSGIAIGTAVSVQNNPAVASNGADYFAAWMDARDGSVQVFGRRITGAGATLDGAGFKISNGTSFAAYPSVAWNGAHYFVVWVDARNGNSDIYGARVTDAGVLTDTTNIAITTGTGEQSAPAIASNGTDFLVAWTDRRTDGSGDIYGALVAAAGTITAGDIGMAAGSPSQQNPSVASNGVNYYAAWTDVRSSTSNVYGSRMSFGGALANPGGVAITSAAGSRGGVSMASNGTEYLAAWMDYRSGTSYDIYGTRLGSTGTVLDANGFAISTNPITEYTPRVAGRANMPYLVVYEARSRARARLVTTCGDGVLDPGEQCDDSDRDSGDGCSAVCVTEPGYSCSGTPSTCTDIDECATNNGGCHVLTTCTNTPGSRSCSACPTGYAGTGATGCTDIDECATNNGGCDALTTCTNSPGSFSCGACPTGYTGTGAAGCTDIDECATSNGGCDVLTTCTNSPGSFSCGACPPGYTGTGAAGCTDIDECATNNGNCDALTTCTNSAGSFACGACPTGYTGTGAAGCTDIDECATNNGGCDALTTCTNSPGSSSCGACPTGYTGTGAAGCTDIDECATNNGGCDALTTCTNSPGSSSCGACPTGYTGTGAAGCTDIDECATNNGGCDPLTTCTSSPGSFTCGACPVGYTGTGLEGCVPDEEPDPEPVPPTEDTGCGCRTQGPASASWLTFVVLGLALRRRRRAPRASAR